MSKRVLINILGKVFIDSEYRKKFRTDTDKALLTISIIRNIARNERRYTFSHILCKLFQFS